MNNFFSGFRQKQLPPERLSLRGRPFWHSAFWHGLEALTLVLALVLALLGGVAWRLAQGPVSLGFLRPDAQNAMAQIFAGDNASIGTLQAVWSAQERALVIVAKNVQVQDVKGAILVQTPQIDVGFSALGLLQGKAMMQRLVAVGGEFSFVRRANGAVGGGLGKPGQITLPGASPGAGIKTRKGSLADVLSHLNVLAMRGAIVHFVDERAGINWVAPHANLRFVRRHDRIIASANGNIVSKAGTASLSLNAFSRPDFSHMSAEIILENAVPAALLPAGNGAWRWLGALDAPMRAQISLTTGEDGLLRTADGVIRLKEGVYHWRDEAIAVHSGQFVFGFDPVDGAVTIALASIDTDRVEGALKGQITGLDPARLVVGKNLGFDLTFENLKLTSPGVLAAPLHVRKIAMKGQYITNLARAEFSDVAVVYDRLELDGSSQFDFPRADRAANAPLFTLKARSHGSITPKAILALWPVQLAKGGRDWIANNVIAATMHDFTLDVRLPRRIIGARHLDNDMLRLAFLYDHAQSHFVHVMTPVRDASGTGVLQGNRFDLSLDHAMLMDTALSDGFVHVPRLSPKGVTGHFGAHARGSLTDVVTLLDEPPLGFVSRYGLDPATMSGKGEVDFAISRPMRVSVPVRKIGFRASGAYADIRVNGLVAGQDLSGVHATFTAVPAGMTVTGKGAIGPLPGRFTWHELFFPDGQPRTRLDIDATVDAQAFDGLGIPTRLFLTGPVDMHMHSSGNGLNIAAADFTARLDAARLMSPGGEWEKPAGQEGTAGFTVKRQDDGGYAIQNLKMRTKGFVLDADLALAPEGGLKLAHIYRAQMQGLFDLSADLERGKNGAFVLNGKAASLDARGFVRGLSRGQSTSFGLALKSHIVFDRALVSDTMTLKDGVIDFHRSAKAIKTLDFHAKTPHGATSFMITSGPDGMRDIKGRADDAGLVIGALFGFTSVRDGVLQINGVLGDGAQHKTRIDLGMKDFRLANVPVMARILSLGSLTGIANTMNGEGLSFHTLIAPLEFDGGRLHIGAARATGPALGITMTGAVDMGKKTINVNGALAPAYTLNSALGKIPLIGKVLISRKGEGLFGLSYRVHGPFDAMEVFVNPLSALTPGVLRRIFEGGSSAALPAPAPPETGEKNAAKTGAKSPAPKQKHPPDGPADPARPPGQ